METIKKQYKSIVSYGLILLGAIILIVVLVLRPTKLSFEEAYNYNQNPKLTEISFPYSLDINIPKNNPLYIELRFEDDSINQYQYSVSLSHNGNNLFYHQYKNEVSNIIQIPIGDKEIKANDSVELTIKCEKSCEKTKINLYDIDGKKYPKILFAVNKHDTSLYWYGIFPIAVGLTLLPLSKEKR